MDGGRSSGPGKGPRGGRGRGGARGRGRSGFSGTLSNLATTAPTEDANRGKGKGKGKGKQSEEGGRERDEKTVEAPPVAVPTPGADLSAINASDAELCFICADPVQLYSVSSCNHRTCHVCAIRLRALYKKKECTFCKATNDELIFTTDGQRNFLSFSPKDIPFKDEKLNVYFENETSREDTLILLRFNCPDPLCEYVASSWTDLRLHAKTEHERFLCELCIKHSRIFVHEHKLYTSSELTRHIRTDHQYCDFCNVNFYSSDELYVHMRDRHEQCFICKRDDDRRDEYQRDYRMLERHFKNDHFLCESKDCLEKKFVVFESEMDFKAHQVAEHGAELSSREKRDALRVTVNFRFDASSSSARNKGGAAGSSGLTARGKPKKEEEPETRRDVLGRSSLASRVHVPGAGGGADHQSRRAQFGSSLTTGKGKTKQREGQGEEEGEEQRANAEKVQRHQQYMDQVHAILVYSDSKLQSFRSNVKVYRAGEMSSKDLVDSIYSLVGDFGQMETIVMGLVDLLEEREKKEDVLQAWNTLRLERTQFPSLAPTFLDSSMASNAAKGQIRNAKASSAASSNNRIWENVERAAASGRGYGGGKPMGSGVARTAAKDQFPVLGSKGGKGANVPGSSRHSAAANASIRGTAWSASAARQPGTPQQQQHSGASTPTPYSVEAIRDPQRSNQTSIRSHPSAFPTLPSSAQAANLAAYKRTLFDSKQSSRGDNSPSKHIWGSSLGRIDGGSDDVDADLLQQKLGEAQIEQQRKRGKQKNVVVTLGSTRRGG